MSLKNKTTVNMVTFSPASDNTTSSDHTSSLMGYLKKGMGELFTPNFNDKLAFQIIMYLHIYHLIL